MRLRLTLPLIVSLLLSAPSAAFARQVEGPAFVVPGQQVTLVGKGFERGERVLARVSPTSCPAGNDTCVNAIWKGGNLNAGAETWKVKRKVRATFTWPDHYLGYPQPMTPTEYQWVPGEQARVQLCEFKPRFKCGSATTTIHQ
jgi:hypothetical protein